MTSNPDQLRELRRKAELEHRRYMWFSCRKKPALAQLHYRRYMEARLKILAREGA